MPICTKPAPPLGYEDLHKQFSIQVIFHGLTMSWFKNNGEYLVGLYNGSLDHKPSLSLAQGDAEPDPLPLGERVKLRVLAPYEGYDRACKLEPPGGLLLTVDDNGFPYYRNHFKWLLNFGELHGNTLQKKLNKVLPRFVIQTGLLFTLQRSIPLTVQFDGDPGETPLGRVAQYHAANIYFRTGAPDEVCAELLIDNHVIFEFRRDTQYKVYWTNTCPTEECVEDDRVIDMTNLKYTFDPPSGRHCTLRRGVPCNLIDNIYALENREIAPQILKALGHNINSRFDPCGGGIFDEAPSNEG